MFPWWWLCWKCSSYKQEERTNPEIHLQPKVIHFVEFLCKMLALRTLAVLEWKGYELWGWVHSNLNVGFPNMDFLYLWLWTTYLTSLSLDFIICVMEILTTTLQGGYKNDVQIRNASATVKEMEQIFILN